MPSDSEDQVTDALPHDVCRRSCYSNHLFNDGVSMTLEPMAMTILVTSTPEQISTIVVA